MRSCESSNASRCGNRSTEGLEVCAKRFGPANVNMLARLPKTGCVRNVRPLSLMRPGRNARTTQPDLVLGMRSHASPSNITVGSGRLGSRARLPHHRPHHLQQDGEGHAHVGGLQVVQLAIASSSAKALMYQAFTGRIEPMRGAVRK